MLILDANAAVEVVLQRKAASIIENALSSHSGVFAPDLFVSEITNVFGKIHRAGLLLKDCEEACARAISLPDAFLSTTEYWQEALAFAAKNQISAYDSFYAVMTQRNRGILATLDSRLQSVCSQNQISVLGI